MTVGCTTPPTFWAIRFQAAGNELGELPHVLLVDRDKMVADMYQLGLEQAGMKVTVVADADSFSKAIQDPLDAVVIEWEMLNVTGEEMLKQLALNARPGGRPIFVLTNFVSRLNDKARTLSHDLGATDWLVKSATSPHQLAARIREALGEDRTREPSGSS